MFKAIKNVLSICLEGTIFRSKPKQQTQRTDNLWSYSMEGKNEYHPYVLTQEEYKIKFDLITKLHSVDNRLQESREEHKRGCAKWVPEKHQQVYETPAPPPPNPQIELYYKALGLNIAREPRITWTTLNPVSH
ncbi:MAG TPA: hypothetical protein V6D22_12520 [Candidatus Obscuribacterales bacterium]